MAGTAGRDLFELGGGAWDVPALRTLLDRAAKGAEKVHAGRVEAAFGDIGRRTILAEARGLADAGGRAETILLALTDVTEGPSGAAEGMMGREALPEPPDDIAGRAELADKLVDSVREAVLVLRPDLTVLCANEAFHETFGATPEETLDRRVYDVAGGAWNLPELRRLLEEILPRRAAHDGLEIDHEFAGIGRRVISLNARRLERTRLILLTLCDLTDARQTETRQKELVGELQHRVKNILANVSALTRQTRRQASTLQEFIDAFEGRLASLARIQDLLVSGPSGSAELGTLVRAELLALGAREGRGLEVSGPALALPSRQAQVLGMVIHELATNALRHGALASESGSLEIRWWHSAAVDAQPGDRARPHRPEPRPEPQTPAAAADGRPRIELVWRERGVPLRPGTLPKGLGTQLIERSAPYMLHGTSSLTAKADGIECRLNFALAAP